MNDRASAPSDDSAALESALAAEDPATVRDAIDELRARGRNDPDALVRVSESLVDCLDHADREVRAGAAAALATLARRRPEAARERLGALAARLDDEYDVARWNALTAVRALAQDDPESVRSLADEVAAFLDASYPQARRDAAFALGNLATVDPEAVADAVPGLADVFGESREAPSRVEEAPLQLKRDVQHGPDDRFEDERTAARNGRVAAGHALFEVSTVAPDAIAAHLGTVLAELDDEDSLVRKTAADIVFGLASRDPDAATDCVDRLGERLGAESSGEVRASLVQALNAVSVAAPDAVGAVAVERAAEIRACLDADEAPVQGAAAGLLGLAAERDPATVADATDRLGELAESAEADYVREAAAAALEPL